MGVKSDLICTWGSFGYVASVDRRNLMRIGLGCETSDLYLPNQKQSLTELAWKINFGEFIVSHFPDNQIQIQFGGLSLMPYMTMLYFLSS